MRHLIRLACFVVFVLQAFPAAAARPRVMVLYFDNNSKDATYEGLSKGLADMMVTDLAGLPSIEVVEREKLEALLAELKLQRSKYFDGKTAQRIGKGVGAQYAVTGAFLSLEPSIRIDVRVIRVDSGVVVNAASVTGKKDDFFKLQAQLTARLAEGLTGVLADKEVRELTAAANQNRVNKLSALADYGAGLDAQDRGDLKSASKHLQKVVTSEPAFRLGKARYAEVMKALYRAKDKRELLLSASEETLLAHAEEALKTPQTSARHVAYRVLLGQYHLTRALKAIEDGKDESSWAGEIGRFVDNQEKLFSGSESLPEYSKKYVGEFSDADESLAEELGIRHAGNTFFLSTPADMMRSSAELLMTGTSAHSPFNVTHAWKIRCPFKIQRNYGEKAVAWLKRALAHIAKHESRYKDREYMRTSQQLAKTLGLLGRTEEGIAVLQEGLEKYPKSDEFEDSEELVRSLLEEPPTVSCKLK